MNILRETNIFIFSTAPYQAFSTNLALWLLILLLQEGLIMILTVFSSSINWIIETKQIEKHVGLKSY